MLSQLTSVLARVRHAEMVETAERRRRSSRASERPPASWGAARRWQGLTVRLATAADRAALTRLARLEDSAAPAGPVLLGVVMQRPVAALSLRDGSVIADPYMPTADVVELLRLRARQLATA